MVDAIGPYQPHHPSHPVPANTKIVQLSEQMQQSVSSLVEILNKIKEDHGLCIQPSFLFSVHEEVSKLKKIVEQASQVR